MKKILAKFVMVILLCTALSATIPVAYAEEDTNSVKPTPLIKPSTLPGPSEEAQMKDGGARSHLVDKVLPRFGVTFIGMIGGIALMFVIFGGVRYMMIFDEDEAIEKAKKQVIYGAVGFLVALLSYTIVRIITNFEFENDTTSYEPSTEIIAYIE